MNGHYKTISTHEKLNNLIEQIPAEYRAQALSHCMPEDGNIYELERKLTGLVIWHIVEDWKFQDEMRQMERDNFATGLDRDGEDTGISQPVIF